ncbi:chromosome segregation protein SMC [Megamonas hypermegale]|uniref:chromosome segregation protein SMC n=1 Tax=Megamonas hypermegale TaxID=158847 RepID=UPI0026EE15EA|nr:chromosome segregation protein SMC [Megamonas hypermegale]
MQLKRLEAYGFKSFADKLEIEFDKGITAIVGPNGSGKSNITDAIRWVLGEQNVRNLRGSKAEDIIFTGSSTRRPLGAAEVSITFDNSDGRLPLDFQEIMITRRIFRSGESEFLINKAKCRLKDIYNLFADTGLGKNSMSVISQNKVDEVLNTKPEERRYFFEECAGITKYRDRKKEALRKLDNTQNNVVRLNDIISEIEKQIGPLKEQAEKTQRYNEVNAQYKDCRLTQILYKYENLSSENQKFTAEIADYETKRTALEATVSVSEAEKTAKQKAITDLEKKLRSLGENNQKIQEEIERSKNQATLLQERIRQSCQSQQRLEERQKQTSDDLKIAQADRDELKRKVAIANNTADKLEHLLQRENAELAELENAIKAKEDELKARQEQENENRRQFEEQKQKLLLLKRDLSDIEQNIDNQHSAHKHALQEKIAKNTAKELLLADIDKTKDKLQAKQSGISSQQENLNELTKTCKKAEETMAQLRQNVRMAEEKVKFFQDMQSSYEGFGKAVKRILKADADWKRGICGAVAELIHVEDPFITAIETALGNAMQNVVTKDTETAKAAINYLKKNKLGRVTFMPLTTIQPHKSKRTEIEAGKYGFIAYADELVDIDSEYKVITQSLLGRILVVDDVDNALKLAKLYDYRLRIVTLEGELLQPGGSIAGGSSQSREAGYLHRAGELAELKDFLTSERKTLKETKAAYDDNEAKRQALAENINSLQKDWQELSLLLAQKDVELKQLEIWFSEQENILQSIDNRISALIVKKTALEVDIENQTNIIAETEKTIGENKTSYDDIQSDIESLKTDTKIKQQKIMQRQISCTEARQEVIRHNDKIKILSGQCERYQIFLDDSNREMTSLQKVIDDSLAELKQLENSAANLDKLKTDGREEYDTLYKRQLGLRSELADMDEERAKIADKVNALKDKIHKCEINTAKLETEIKQCIDQLREEYELSPEEALLHRLDIEENELKTKLRKLEKELKSIGAVNPNAINEYETLNERYSFMTKQIDDLIKAKDDLLKIIEQIDKTMSSQFSTAFEQIKIHFDDIFRQLFGGGKANLILTNKEDILNSGIEIEVEPPDKKPQSLAVLSGGERTLTVIALLFAFFTYNPAPFSVLDEIDAPLDEANVKRFAKFLREYAQNTQFILVTHRKGTMEAADVMYGVTIEDAGVSKLISVRLEDYTERG